MIWSLRPLPDTQTPQSKNMENTPTMDVVLRRDTLVEATTELENVIDVERTDDNDVDEEYDAHRGIRVEYADGDVE